MTNGKNSQGKFANKWQLFREFIYYKFLFFYQATRNRDILCELRNLSISLESMLLPSLAKCHEQWAELVVSEGGGRLVIKQEASELNLPGTGHTAKALFNIGVKTVQLDTRLESGQIVEAISVLIHAGSMLPKGQSTSPGSIYNNYDLARALCCPEGIHEFCAQVNYFSDQHLFKVEYSYCELFYTYILRQFLSRFSHTQNHRAIFAFAPWAGGISFLLLFYHIWFWGTDSGLGLIAGFFASLVFGGVVGYLIQTLASTIYDQEHRDVVLQENFQKIKALSHFPQNNPNPIIKINVQGELVFHNRATQNLLDEIGATPAEIIELLPDNYVELAEACLSGQSQIEYIEVSKHDRTLRYKMSPFPNEPAVLLAGNDITRLKGLERNLRELNQTLEQKVIERTLELESTQDVTILSLSSLAETRDPETGAHIQRTRLYVKLLAEQLRSHPRFTAIDDDTVIDLLFRSAPLHDIGKVGIPDSILLKPGKLTDEEFDEMKKHASIGGDSLRWAEEQLGSNSFLKYAREIAYHHHEKWDGSGYPFGMAGDDIPFSGRLMALADVYDALISKRVYKDAFSHEKAKGIILEGRGNHFDTDVVEAFIAIEDKFIEIATQYKEPTD